MATVLEPAVVRLSRQSVKSIRGPARRRLQATIYCLNLENNSEVSRKLAAFSAILEIRFTGFANSVTRAVKRL